MYDVGGVSLIPLECEGSGGVSRNSKQMPPTRISLIRNMIASTDQEDVLSLSLGALMQIKGNDSDKPKTCLKRLSEI